MNNQSNIQNNGQGFAIVGLITGIVAVLLSFIPCFGGAAIAIGIAAIVFGAVALSKAKMSGNPRGMSIAGLSLGVLAMLIGLLWLVVVIGARDRFQGNFNQFFDWVEQIDEHELDIDLDEEFDNEKSLEELERALDDLEGVADEVDAVVDEAQEVIEEGLEEAQQKIEEANEKPQEE